VFHTRRKDSKGTGLRGRSTGKTIGGGHGLRCAQYQALGLGGLEKGKSVVRRVGGRQKEEKAQEGDAVKNSKLAKSSACVANYLGQKVRWLTEEYITIKRRATKGKKKGKGR